MRALSAPLWDGAQTLTRGARYTCSHTEGRSSMAVWNRRWRQRVSRWPCWPAAAHRHRRAAARHRAQPLRRLRAHRRAAPAARLRPFWPSRSPMISRRWRLEVARRRGKGKVAAILPDTTSSTRYVEFDQPDLRKALEAAGVPSSDIIIQNAQKSDPTFLTDAQTDITNGATVLLSRPRGFRHRDPGREARGRPWSQGHRL